MSMLNGLYSNPRYAIKEYAMLDVSGCPDGPIEIKVATQNGYAFYHAAQNMCETDIRYSIIRGFVKGGKLHGEYRRIGDVEEHPLFIDGVEAMNLKLIPLADHLLFIDGVEAMNLKLIPLADHLKLQLALQYGLEFL